MTGIRRLNMPDGSAVLADLRRALQAGPGRPADFHRRIGRWARTTIRQALADLVTLGEVVHEGPEGLRVYRLAGKGERP